MEYEDWREHNVSAAVSVLDTCDAVLAVLSRAKNTPHTCAAGTMSETTQYAAWKSLLSGHVSLSIPAPVGACSASPIESCEHHRGPQNWNIVDPTVQRVDDASAANSPPYSATSLPVHHAHPRELEWAARWMHIESERGSPVCQNDYTIPVVGNRCGHCLLACTRLVSECRR